ncbi:MAG: hypothetical protein M1839_001175 [Geoglossum umbratile]|nr:MAG: hypothetical protein M1839_001175 [Geoglossum umbratile]
MPTKRWIDKKSATTFALVHRPQNDPKIHDEDASDMVFKEVATPNQKVKTRNDLEEELHLDPTSLRANEGEAALHGVYYDDTSYDYMQHMRDLGASTEAHFVEAPSATQKQREKGKQKLEDALRDISIEGGRKPAQPLLVDEDILPSRNLRKATYQDQQDVPDVLAGFQPDMDPRLREALEALEDEAYVDDDEDVFGELVKDGVEVPLEEFVGEDAWEEEGDGGWETDDTAKPEKEYKKVAFSEEMAGDVEMMDSNANPANTDWMSEFNKYKKAEKTKKAQPPPSNSDLQSSVATGTSLINGRRKKRKGALTSSTGYSMTSSSLFRTEGLRTLDDRFEKIEEEYAADDDMGDAADDVSVASSTNMSQDPIREDFDTLMDDFLGSYSMSGKKRVKKGKYQTGIEQLDELRRGLGPARIRPQKA